MNIYSVPMLISGILCALLAAVTWLFRRRENINRIFSLFTLALAIDSLALFIWFQFGSIDHIDTWMRITFTAGFFVPTGLILFFYSFTGYYKRLESRVLGIKVKYFRIFSLLTVLLCILLAQFTNLLIRVSEAPEDIWDLEFGPVGNFVFPFFAVIFIYLFTMAFKGYRIADNKPQKRFILLLGAGTAVWVLFGYGGALLFPISSQVWNSISYLGTALMAMFFFVAIVNHQSDKVHELNLNLERKVEDRTQQLNQKNTELEETLDKLKQMQKQVVMQEKMATLGQLVAGMTHELNTPISTIRSMNDTKAKAAAKLQTALKKIAPDTAKKDHEISRVMDIIGRADRSIDQGAERLHEIIKNLKNYARLDEGEVTRADIHEGLDSVLALMKHDLLTNIVVVREYGDIPPFVCHARKLNQVFFNIIKNAAQAIDGKGRITITTGLEDNIVHVAIRDTGRGIAPGDLESIFDPDFTTKGSVVRASLGLSISYQIIQEHHGKIEVESEPGKGSVFTVILPNDSV